MFGYPDETLSLVFDILHENYLQLIKDGYPSIEHKYQDVENKQLLWELITMEIRAETIRYSKTKRFNMKTREIAIQLKLEELDQKNM